MTATRALVLHVRLHDGRYHGVPEWPPAPGRLFQALVAGGSPGIDGVQAQAMRWLEARPAPTIGAPSALRGQAVNFFVPNNDLDAKGGDPEEIPSLRVSKLVQPQIFDPDIPLLYVWPIEPADEGHATAIIALSERLYQLGRGVDMAYARGEILASEALERLLASYPGHIYRPTPGAVGHDLVLPVPGPGSYESLVVRHEANSQRFVVEGSGKKASEVFVQPPKPRFARVPYDAPVLHALFELRLATNPDTFAPAPPTAAPAITEAVRDAALARLTLALPDRTADLTRILIGGSKEAPVPREQRVRLVPLPSIGHTHTDPSIRRILVEIPTSAAIPADDLCWGFSGLPLEGPPERILVTAVDRGMLEEHYTGPSRLWRTVTAAALPQSASRRRIDPDHRVEQAKGGPERAEEERNATFAVRQALRHADIDVPVEAIRVQREPFGSKGERAEAFASPPRFPKERLWHVEITFREPASGPIILGDGRYLGLGLMAPEAHADAVFAFAVTGGLSERPDPLEISVAMRRATMALAQRHLGGEELPPLFSGHSAGGGPAQSESDPHLLFLFDAERARILVVAPHLAERRSPRPWEREHLATLARALSGLRELRAGGSGRLALRPVRVDLDSDPLFAASSVWESQTTYQVTRHAHRTAPGEVLAADIRAECLRRGLPEPVVTPLGLKGVPEVGLVGGARLTFAVAVPGPLLLGRSRHRGGGLFAAVAG